MAVAPAAWGAASRKQQVVVARGLLLVAASGRTCGLEPGSERENKGFLGKKQGTGKRKAGKKQNRL